MQTWAKRGIQTALVTGGLLMLGTGIASADENPVNPDMPAGPLDVNASVPVNISQNAVGTLGKQVNLPEVHKELSTKPVTDKLNRALAPVSKTGALKPATPAMQAANAATAKATGVATQAGQSLDAANKRAAYQAPVSGPAVQSNGDPAMGNKVVGNLAVPIEITGNAVGVLGNAAVASHESQSYSHNTDVSTSGRDGGLAGNVVNLDWALPLQISGNALGLAGSGKTYGSALQTATTTGDVTTDGTNGGLAGNVLSPQGATPVQVSGNAIGAPAGHAQSDFDSYSDATSGGWIVTEGSHGAATGNVAGVPVALPLKASNNGISAGGDSDAGGSAASDALAGYTTPGIHGGPTFIQTHGDDAFLAGNVAQPQLATPATVVGNAAAAIGNSAAGTGVGRAADVIGTSASAGGFTSTSGQDGAVSGNILDAPAAIPAEVFCDGAAVIGNAHADGCDNNTTATSGGGTYTNGNGGFLGGNSVDAQPAGTGEVYGIGGALLGNASGSASEYKNVTAGGYNGSQGNNSTGSGNVGQVPVALPAEVFGAGAGALGQAQGAACETKDVTAGGGGNTQDDFGSISANLIAVPVSLPAQVFGVGAAAAGQGHGIAETDTTSTAGGELNAAGNKGFLAGNLGDVPVSLPAQVHGLGAALGGIGFGAGKNLTDSTAGGDSTATGAAGSIAGNIVQAPVGGAASVFGDGAVLGGLVQGVGINDVASSAGGDSATNGNGGSIAGNVISPQVLPIVQVFGDAISGVGVANGLGINHTQANSGGNIATSGAGGALSGDIFDVPVGAVAQVFGVAASLGGVAHAVADNTTVGTVGGTDNTTGPVHALSGLDNQLPVGVVAQVYNVPAGLIGVVSSEVENYTHVDVAKHEAFDMPVTMSELPATALPRIPAMKSLPMQRADRADLTDAATGATAVTQILPQVPSMAGAGMLPTGQLPDLSQVSGLASGKGLHIQG